MKFLQVSPFYPQYLAEVYARHPGLDAQPYRMQIRALLDDGFSAGHMIAPYLEPEGFDWMLVIPNCLQLQGAWAREHGLGGAPTLKQVLAAQITTVQPDIFYTTDPITYDSRFLRTLDWTPPLVAGWRSASIPPRTDFSSYDLIVSNSRLCLERAREHGARATARHLPGMAPHLLPLLGDTPPAHDVVFSGQWTTEHQKRNRLLAAVADARDDPGRTYDAAYYLLPKKDAPLPPAVQAINRGARWGLEMYRALQSGRINLNATIDLVGDEAGNMRLFEVTAVGSFLLTEHHENLRAFFEPGVEIETWRTPGECIEKIRYYLDHDDERTAIAARGHERCLREHTIAQRARALGACFAAALRAKGAGPSAADSLPPPPAAEDVYDKAYRTGWADPKLRELVYHCYKTPDFADNARRFADSAEFREALRLLGTLGVPPAPDTTVLDFGCGNGVATYALARAGYDVTGLDSSLGALAGLHAAKKLQGLDNVSFRLQHGTGEGLAFPDGTFDLVWIREALHHMTDPAAFLREVKRVLKPGGVVCCLRDVVVWNEAQRAHFFATHPFYPITHDEGCFALQEYLDAFRNAGLRLEQVLAPCESVINTYPNPLPPHRHFDADAAKRRTRGYDLFSFFARKEGAVTPDQIEQTLAKLNSGDAQGALDDLETMQAGGEQSGMLDYARAVALARLGRSAEAVSLLERVVAAYPQVEEAKPLLAELRKLTTGAAPPADVPDENRAVFRFGIDAYDPVLLSPGTIANLAASRECWDAILAFHQDLITDDYVRYVDAFYREGVARFGAHWHYMDIVNVLYAAATLLQPRHYLEIGVRTGRSLCTVAKACPTVNAVGIDMWLKDYGGMENPGPECVDRQLAKVGAQGNITYITGNSHEVLPALFEQNPGIEFDLITVDGDHGKEGALKDLCDVIPHLAVGGVLVFDDIVHPAHPYLREVWREAIRRHPALRAYEYTELGYGVAFAVRTRPETT